MKYYTFQSIEYYNNNHSGKQFQLLTTPPTMHHLMQQKKSINLILFFLFTTNFISITYQSYALTSNLSNLKHLIQPIINHHDLIVHPFVVKFQSLMELQLLAAFLQHEMLH